MSSNLRSRTIRLAHANPELRSHLLPLLTKVAAAVNVHGKHVLGAAMVDVNAKVYGRAKVSEYVIVRGTAEVYGDARVYGDVTVGGDAHVYGDAKVYGFAQVYGDAHVYGDAKVYGRAHVYGDANISGTAIITGGNWDGSEGPITKGTWKSPGVRG